MSGLAVLFAVLHGGGDFHTHRLCAHREYARVCATEGVRCR